ncbi:MAG: hypothetical protein WCP85_12430 [Mariniphaga sp.]
MVPIFKKSFVILLSPQCINILLALFGRIVFRKIVSVAFLDLYVFIQGVALERYFCKTGITIFQPLNIKTFIIQVNLEIIELVFYKTYLCEFLSKQPDVLFIGYHIPDLKLQNIH